MGKEDARSMLYRYLYISTSPDLSRDEVDHILGSSQRNNAKADITGMLVYNGRNFLQLLEGQSAELDALMRRIGNDQRHTGISMLHRAEIDERSCPNWAMRRIAIGKNANSRRESVMQDLPGTLDDQTRDLILNFATLN